MPTVDKRECPECHARNRLIAKKCYNCGYDFAAGEKREEEQRAREWNRQRDALSAIKRDYKELIGKYGEKEKFLEDQEPAKLKKEIDKIWNNREGSYVNKYIWDAAVKKRPEIWKETYADYRELEIYRMRSAVRDDYIALIKKNAGTGQFSLRDEPSRLKKEIDKIWKENEKKYKGKHILWSDVVKLRPGMWEDAYATYLANKEQIRKNREYQDEQARKDYAWEMLLKWIKFYTFGKFALAILAVSALLAGIELIGGYEHPLLLFIGYIIWFFIAGSITNSIINECEQSGWKTPQLKSRFLKWMIKRNVPAKEIPKYWLLVCCLDFGIAYLLLKLIGWGFSSIFS